MLALLTPLAGLLGIEAEHLVARLKGLVLIYAAIALLGLTGLGFLLAAGFMVLAEAVGPFYASLIMAGIFLLLALVLYLGMAIGERRNRRVRDTRRRSSETGAFLTTAAITALPVVLRSPLLVKLGLPAAAIAAFTLLRRDD